MFGFPFRFLPYLSQVHSCFGFPSNTATSRNSVHLWAQCCDINVISYQWSWFLQSPFFLFPIHYHLMRHVLKQNRVCVCCLISTIIWTNESSLTLCFIPPLTKDILAFRMLVPLGVDSLLFYLYALKSCLKLSSRDHVYIETIQKITYSTIDVWIVLESFHYRQKWQKYQQDDTNK